MYMHLSSIVSVLWRTLTNTVMQCFCKLDIIISLPIRKLKLFEKRHNLKFTQQMDVGFGISIQACMISNLILCLPYNIWRHTTAQMQWEQPETSTGFKIYQLRIYFPTEDWLPLRSHTHFFTHTSQLLLTSLIHTTYILYTNVLLFKAEKRKSIYHLLHFICAFCLHPQKQIRISTIYYS